MLRDQLGTLKARKRRAGEAEYNAEKRPVLDQRREYLCQITSLQHFLAHSSSSSAAASLTDTHEQQVDRLMQANSAANKKLQQLHQACEEEERAVRQSAQEFCDRLNEVELAHASILALESKLVGVSLPQAPTINDDSELLLLEEQLAQQEQDITAMRAKLVAAQHELETVDQDRTRLQILHSEAQRTASERQALEGPQREQIDVMMAFTKLKTSVHERLAGYRIVSTKNGRLVELALNGEGEEITVELEFDSQFRCVHISTSKASPIAGSKLESELRLRALERNDPASFLRQLKLLVHNARVLDKELAELKRTSASSSFALEYKPATRTVSCLFGELFTAKLRVPLDYNVSPVELVQLESTLVRKREPSKDRQLEQAVRAAVSGAGGGGLRVRDWVLKIRELTAT